MKLRSEKGFTLIETLVVIFITTMLSGLLLTYGRSSERQIVLYRDQALLVGLLNRAKNLAIEKYNKPDDLNAVACAFGVHFSDISPVREFILFQDLGVQGCGPGINDNAYSADNPAEKLELFNLDERLRFLNIPAGGIDILFVPPELSVISNVVLPLTLTIQSLEGDFTAPVTISDAGQITVE